ncbi:13813_t:CDS:2 [Dentiscutata heterogama]|uniref:13813_t:CDS:1 n=1 Tax=Dentiscutata heterogama TaxID=1316150 RepID=A0ACA9K428_9GLOM|nr:13813_t:CDS:2 [Dentiscutata heterogama]
MFNPIHKAAKMLKQRGVDWDSYQKIEGYVQNQLENIQNEVKQIYHSEKSNNIELSKVAINVMTTLYESFKPYLAKALEVSDVEYVELVKMPKVELFEFDSYYYIVRWQDRYICLIIT